MEKPSLLRNRLTRQIRSFSADKTNLEKILRVLQERSYAAADIELQHFKKGDLTAEKYKEDKKLLREGFELKLTLNGTDGQELYGSISELFNSPNFPDELTSIYVNSEIPLTTSYQYYPRNSFILFLDFTKPDIFDFSFMPSQATPNKSNITVTGYDATWVHGLFNEFNTFLDKRPSQFSWLHRHTVYDILLWVFGFPFGFWSAYKLSGVIQAVFGNVSIFVQSAAYVYIFFAALFLFRMLFHYARWICPLIEYKTQHNKSLKHRLFLGSITVGLIGKVVYDVIKASF
jgi:hypothetical protein